MPSKIRPTDWDYYFSSNRPRRGGPLRVLSNILICGIVLTLLGVGGVFGFNAYTVRQTGVRQTAIARNTADTAALVTRTARAQTTREARAAASVSLTATAGAATPTVPNTDQGTVIAGGNLRSAPRIASETVVGLVWPGDEVLFLEQQATTNGVWYRIRVTREATNRGGVGVAAGTEGWVNSTLLSAPGR